MLEFVRNRPHPGHTYKVISKSLSYIRKYGENSEIWIEGTAEEELGENFMEKKDPLIRFYLERRDEIHNPRGEVFCGLVYAGKNSSHSLVDISEIGDDIGELRKKDLIT